MSAQPRQPSEADYEAMRRILDHDPRPAKTWSTTIMSSDGNRLYTVEERLDTRKGGTYLFCPCPGWKFSIAKGGCYHVRMAAHQRDAERMGVAFDE